MSFIQSGSETKIYSISNGKKLHGVYGGSALVCIFSSILNDS